MTRREFVGPWYFVNKYSVAASKDLGRNAGLGTGATLGPLEVQTLYDKVYITLSAYAVLCPISAECAPPGTFKSFPWWWKKDSFHFQPRSSQQSQLPREYNQSFMDRSSESESKILVFSLSAIWQCGLTLFIGPSWQCTPHRRLVYAML